MSDPTEINRLAALTKDEQQIRKNAYRLAGLYLQGAKEEVIECHLSDLDEEITEDDELYAAQEALIEKIADEVIRIGEDLSQQAKEACRIERRVHNLLPNQWQQKIHGNSISEVSYASSQTHER